MLEIIVVTLFPDLIHLTCQSGVLSRAAQGQHLNIKTIDYRAFTNDKHQTVDDRPFGGGSGMVLKPDICLKALRYAQSQATYDEQLIAAFSPCGQTLKQKIFTQLKEESYSKKTIILFCGRYEGFDQRFLDLYVQKIFSLGDFVLSGGEYPAICFIDALARLLPGTLSEHSLEHESFNNQLLDYPNYTRPKNFEGIEPPSVLLTGDHARIETWRCEQAKAKTAQLRPDLLNKTSEIEQ